MSHNYYYYFYGTKLERRSHRVLQVYRCPRCVAGSIALEAHIPRLTAAPPTVFVLVCSSSQCETWLQCLLNILLL